MRKALAAAGLALLVLAPPVSAKTGSEMTMAPELTQLRAGTTQTVTMRLVRVSDRGGRMHERPLRGVQPLLTLENLDTHRRVTAVGTASDARGRSRLRVDVPARGRWRPTVLAGHQGFDLPTLAYGPFDSAGPSPRSPAGGAFPWLPAIAGALAALAAAGLLARRRPKRARPRLDRVR
jgi:hypothetical protein